MAQLKERGGVWEERQVSFLPLPLPPLSFFGSRFISRAVKTENPFPRSFFAKTPNGNACYAGYFVHHQGVRSQGFGTLIRALWFSCDAEQDWNQLAFPLSIRCQGKKNGAVQLEVGSDLLLYIFRSLQSIIRFDIWRISM